MAKQSAVEWLMEQITYDNGYGQRWASFRETSDLSSFFEQAKAIEKAQHQISFDKGYDRRNYIHDFEYGGVEYWEEEPKEFKEYYEENYGL